MNKGPGLFLRLFLSAFKDFEKEKENQQKMGFVINYQFVISIMILVQVYLCHSKAAKLVADFGTSGSLDNLYLYDLSLFHIYDNF